MTIAYDKSKICFNPKNTLKINSIHYNCKTLDKCTALTNIMSSPVKRDWATELQDIDEFNAKI